MNFDQSAYTYIKYEMYICFDKRREANTKGIAHQAMAINRQKSIFLFGTLAILA